MFKSIIFAFALISTTYSFAIGKIDGHVVTGSTKQDYYRINNAVIAVRVLKRQRADKLLSDTQYIIRVRNILKTLQVKGITVK